MTTPAVPQRPNRSQESAAAPTSQEPVSVPQIPPRPARNAELAAPQLPHRDSASRSPLNDPPSRAPVALAASSLRPEATLRERPSISALPLIGQEGEEYNSFERGIQTPQISEPTTPFEARGIAGDLPLHAPTASSNHTQIAPVVRTISHEAAQAGIGKPSTEYDDGDELGLRKTASRSSGFLPPTSGLSRELTRDSANASRPASVHEDLDERGIPHFGSFVPMYPNAGDVQAPSPSPYHAHGPSSGVGFHNNDASRPPTGDRRRKSAAGFHGPAGSYGLHGHGMLPKDQFEKDWYKKHPEELLKEEQGTHGASSALSRHEWVLSSDELNKLVRDTDEPGFGTNPDVIGVPTEAIGYKASEEYASRTGSPALRPVPSSDSRDRVSSPLKKALGARDMDVDDDRIHLAAPARSGDKYTGAGYDPPTYDLGPNGGNTSEKGGWIDERGTGTPILASDEMEKRAGSEWRQAAVAAEAAKHADGEYLSEYDSDSLPAWQRRKTSDNRRSKSARRPSRPSSAKFHAQDFNTHGTHLNEIEEYEPLFKEGDDGQQLPLTAADKLKRPDFHERRFPSQDIWEDTPNSLQLETTVNGPQEPEDTPKSATAPPHAHFELPEKELARKGEITEPERRSFLSDMVKAKPKFGASVQEEMGTRPTMRHKFPSKDVWEDTPDSARLETTIDPDDATMRSPTGGDVPANNNLARNFEAADRALGAAVAKPAVPSRPSRTRAPEPTEPQSPTDKRAPSIPERPKPVVPTRPAKTTSPDERGEDTTVTKNLSGGSGDGVEGAETASAKAKPPVAQKSSKFASIKAGFMENLNSRLQLGPTPPKPAKSEEAAEEDEKPPLADARKSRARGPARRTPKAEGASNEAPSTASPSSWSMTAPRTLFSLHNGRDSVLAVNATPSTAATTAKTAPHDFDERPTASPLATNTAGESLLPAAAAPHTVAGELASTSNATMDQRAAADDAAAKQTLKAYDEATIGHVGDVPEGVPEPAVEGFQASAAQAGERPEPAKKALDASATGALPTDAPASTVGHVDGFADAGFGRQPAESVNVGQPQSNDQ